MESNTAEIQKLPKMHHNPNKDFAPHLKERKEIYYQSFYLPTDAQNNCFKRILKFTLKQLQHVSVLSPSSGSVQFEFAKVTFVKIVH